MISSLSAWRGDVDVVFDEETLRVMGRAKELGYDAASTGNFAAAKQQKSAAGEILVIAKQLKRCVEEERAAAAKDDFDVAMKRKAEGELLAARRDELVEKQSLWNEKYEEGGEGAVDSVKGIDDGMSRTGKVMSPARILGQSNSMSSEVEREPRFHFMDNFIVSQDDNDVVARGLSEIEEAVSAAHDQGQRNAAEGCLGKGNASLSNETREVLQWVFGSKLLGLLISTQEANVRKFGFNIICDAIRNGHLRKEMDKTNGSILTILVPLCDFALRDDDEDIHNCGIELTKLVFCPPTREVLWNLNAVAMSDLKLALARLVQAMCCRAACLFKDGPGEGEENDRSDTSRISGVKATIASLARQPYLGAALIASAGCGELKNGHFLEFCGALFCTETLIEEFGCLDDSYLDLADVCRIVRKSMVHVNHNTRQRGADVVRAMLAKCIVSEEEMRDLSADWQFCFGSEGRYPHSVSIASPASRSQVVATYLTM